MMVVLAVMGPDRPTWTSPDGGSLAAGLKSGGILVLAARRTALDLTIEKGRGVAVTALRYAPKVSCHTVLSSQLFSPTLA